MTRRTLILLVLLAAVAQVPCPAADWSHQGADAGMSKYTPDNIPADAPLQLRHKKRFCGRWTACGGSYFYAYGIVTRNGQAAAIAEDHWVPPAYNDLALTKFDFGSLAGDPNFDPACDPDSDGAVDVVDLLMLVDNWGK